MKNISRRNVLAGMGIATASYVTKPLYSLMSRSPFNIAVITDEISPDFDHACSVISKDFGLQWVELRTMWGKSLHSLTDAQLADMEKIISKYNLRVTDLASPVFKVDWPGAPKSSFGSKHDSLGVDETFKHQDNVLSKYIALAKRFKTDKIRCFDFWRLDDVKPYRSAIDQKLQEAAEVCGKQGVALVIENEFECNTATASEAARTLSAVPSPHFGLNWDAGNAVMTGELDAFPLDGISFRNTVFAIATSRMQ
jgi:sugar phosphate isomerase/epimerase